MNKIIAVSMRSDQTPFNEAVDSLASSWSELLHSQGFICTPVPNAPSLTIPYLTTLNPSAVILSGGNSLSRDYTLPDACPNRDQTETHILKYALTHNLPVIGICRGMQMLMVYFHSLYPQKTNSHAGRRHDICVADPSTFIWPFKFKEQVMSYHNFGFTLSEIPKDWQILASYRNITEAIIHKTLPIVGIQWHPERQCLPRLDHPIFNWLHNTIS